MDLPIKFPSDAEVIAEEVTRFRALSAEEQVRTLDEMVRLYYFLTDHADRPDAVARFADEEEYRGRTAIEQFVARHDRP